MSDRNTIACESLLAPAGIGSRELDRVMGQLMASNVDAADLYFQSTRYESWVLEDSIVKEGSYNIEQGAGLRAVAGEKTGFAYSDEIVMPALLEAAGAARSIARSGQQGSIQVRAGTGGLDLYGPIDPLASLDEAGKVDMLRRVDAEARRLDPRVREVIVSLSGSHDTIVVAGSDGSINGNCCRWCFRPSRSRLR